MQLPDSSGGFLARMPALALAGFFLCCETAFAEDPLPDVERLRTSSVLQHLKSNPMAAPPRSPAEQTLAKMYLPEGFRADLIAAEPDLHQPIAFALDERGRIWVAEAYSYPQKQPAGKGLDQIVILADRDGDGRFESRQVFARGLNLVSGLEVGYGGVWVGAAPELLFIADRNRDDVPDGPPQILLDGFGYQDTHECLNSFLWGPDGWLYGNQGVFNHARIGKPGAPDAQRVTLRAGVWRYHPTRHEFEVFAEGGSNQWGLDYDERGQLFMTHCRSYWGRGPTTHVIQGGHFWNQANANHAPFIVASPPPDFPQFRNYLLASARYGHGAGGAGPRGSDAIYGGHSHVGTMIYLGDQWPDEYRGRLFTHNLHGHQINQQVNVRAGSGFETVHAGRDQFFCSDPKYVAVDLQYGPDGAVYVIDWYDQQHCHNPNSERWDRGNGRIYRLQWDASYKPVKVDLSNLEDAKLAELHRHKNEWHVRTARRLLHERAQTRPIQPEASAILGHFATNHADPRLRLRALWTMSAIGQFSGAVARQALGDADEYVRAWAIQLSAERKPVQAELLTELVRLAKTDPSPVVRLYLASAIQRVPADAAWQLIEILARHGEDRSDRNLPFLLWQSLARQWNRNRPEAKATEPGLDAAPSGQRNLDRAFQIAERTLLPQLADWIYWYAATFEGDGLDRVLTRLDQAKERDQRRLLAGVELAIEARGRVAMPAPWRRIAPKLYASEDARIVRQAERLAAAFGDDTIFPRLRVALTDAKAPVDLRKHAFAVLSRAPDPDSSSAFLQLLDDDAFRLQAIRQLGRFDHQEIPEALIRRFDRFTLDERTAALNALTSRASFALALLDAVAAGELKRDQLTAFHVRQLTQFGDAQINERVATAWGKVSQTPAERQARIAQLEKAFNEAPLWAYSVQEGRKHFQKLCAQCHRLQGEGILLGPDLTGMGNHGVRYVLENVIDPNAVIGTDFQMTAVETKSGDLVSGILANETPTTLTVRTTTESIVLRKSEIAHRMTSENSIMPEGLLEALSEREQLELLKFLTAN